MARHREKVRMSSIIPRKLAKKLVLLAVKFLPFKWRDVLSRYWVQTRLLFSRTILILVVAMFAFFTWATIEQHTFREQEAFYFLMVQSIGLGILLHMGLWEKERDGRTFELLIMRIPRLHELIWFKLRVSLFWVFFLSLPFFIGYTWFISIPVWRMLVYLLFCMTVSLFAVFLTSVVSSFVHSSLATGIIAVILMWVMAGFLFNARIPRIKYFQIFLMPFNERYGTFENFWLLFLNRLILLFIILALYGWFYERLKKTEKWIL